MPDQNDPSHDDSDPPHNDSDTKPRDNTAFGTSRTPTVSPDGARERKHSRESQKAEQARKQARNPFGPEDEEEQEELRSKVFDAIESHPEYDNLSADELEEAFSDIGYEASEARHAQDFVSETAGTTTTQSQDQPQPQDHPQSPDYNERTPTEMPSERQNDEKTPTETQQRQQRAHTVRGQDMNDTSSRQGQEERQGEEQGQGQGQEQHPQQPRQPQQSRQSQQRDSRAMSDDVDGQDLTEEEALQRTINDRNRTLDTDLQTPYRSVSIRIKKADQEPAWDFYNKHQDWIDRVIGEDPAEDSDAQAELRELLEPYRNADGNIKTADEGEEMTIDDLPEDVQDEVRRLTREITDERTRGARTTPDPALLRACKRLLCHGRENPDGSTEPIVEGVHTDTDLVVAAIKSGQVPAQSVVGVAVEADEFALENDLGKSFRRE
jgi:hypothetical protein